MSAKRKKVQAVVMRSALTGEYWAIPRTAEAYDQMVQQVAKIRINQWGELYRPHVTGLELSRARAALRAIGIVRPSTSRDASHGIVRPKENKT